MPFIATEGRVFIPTGGRYQAYRGSFISNLLPPTFRAQYDHPAAYQNRMLTSERSFKRKDPRSFSRLHQSLKANSTQDQILEAYLNDVQYGRRHHYGVKRAARDYFGKSLTSSPLRVECAMLAGIVNAPTHLNPRRTFICKEPAGGTNERT